MHVLRCAAIAACVASPSLAGTANSRWDVDITMTSTVTKVTGGGKLFGAEGYIRDFSVDEFSRFGWGAGDVFKMRWRISPKDTFSCLDGYEELWFGGTAQGGEGGEGAAGQETGCGIGPAAVETSLQRADGTSTLAIDGWDGSHGEGPVFNLRTGELTMNYEIADGLVTMDCCFYYFDPELDKFFSVPGAGRRSDVHAFLYGTEYYFDLGDQWDATPYWLEIDEVWVHFDTVWKATVKKVPEPATFALFGLGLLGVAVRRRRHYSAAAGNAFRVEPRRERPIDQRL